jgi:predicted nucleic acid-binding protein
MGGSPKPVSRRGCQRARCGSRFRVVELQPGTHSPRYRRGMSQRVVIDANRIFSELIGVNRKLRQTFASQPEAEFFCPKYVLVALFKHKERIHFFDEDVISIGNWTEAWRLCRDVDEDDAAYVALTLEHNANLWTGDQELEVGLRKKGSLVSFLHRDLGWKNPCL